MTANTGKQKDQKERQRRTAKKRTITKKMETSDKKTMTKWRREVERRSEPAGGMNSDLLVADP